MNWLARIGAWVTHWQRPTEPDADVVELQRRQAETQRILDHLQTEANAERQIRRREQSHD